MYKEFKFFLEDAETLGRIVRVSMYENFASVELVNDDGEEIKLTMSKEEVK